MGKNIDYHFTIFFSFSNKQPIDQQVEIIELGLIKREQSFVFVGMRNNKSVIRKKKKRSTGPSNRNSNEAFCYGRK